MSIELPGAVRRRSGGWVLLLFPGILLGIWQAQPEIAIALAEGGVAYAEYVGSFWMKVLKDIYLLVAWFYLVIFVRDPFPKWVSRSVSGIYFVVAVSFLLAVLNVGVLMALAGLRWFLAVFVFLELRRLHGRYVNGRAVSLVLLLLLLLHVGLQVERMFTFPPLWGERWGLSARPPGYFLIPNTGAMFAVACAALSIDFVGRRHWIPLTILPVAILSAFLAQSGGGLLACLCLLVFLLFRRLSLLIPVILVLGIGFVFASTALLGREGFVEISGGERIAKWLTAFSELGSVGGFGLYTNTGFLLAAASTVAGTQEEPVISDSFYVALLGNFGALVFVVVPLFVIAIRHASVALRAQSSRLGTASLLTLAFFSFSSVVSEAFPMNLMLAVGVWAGAVCAPSHRDIRRRPIKRDRRLPVGGAPI